MRRLKIYIAGPISKGDLQENINQARDAAEDLIAEGFAPLCPHLTCFLESNTPCRLGTFTHTEWLEVDIPWVLSSDAVLRLPGESLGADMEVEAAKLAGIPIYTDIERLVQNPPSRGHDGYLKILKQMELLHKKKAADYGTDQDLFANIRQAEEIGIEAWRAAYLRSRDKVKRIDAYCTKGTLANEGVEDSFMDNAAYNIIALLMFREEQEKRQITTKE